MMKNKKEMEAALCFVPEMLVDYLNKSNIKVLEPASYFMHGVCLLVDISGFTKLSGQFCDQGKAGIDDLQLATNGFMGRLVDIIYSFGGDIIKFAGDAIICIFSANFIPIAEDRPIRRSSMCNLAILEDFYNTGGDPEASSIGGSISINTLSSISADVILRVMHCAKLLTEVQTDKLTVHVAMSCGEMCFGILGGFENRWECLISGPCVHQLSGCLDDAPSKHAVISHSCADIIKDAIFFYGAKSFAPLTSRLEANGRTYSFSILPLISGNYQVISTGYVRADAACASPKTNVIIPWVDEQRSELVKLFVPLPIADQLEQGVCSTYMAQIREVTTMFMKWDSYDPNGKHRDLLQLQDCFYQTQRILQSTGAYLRQFLVDDKGCVLIACWGMPHLSYLDNAHRAVTAAAQIRIACYQLEMNCSFGITTGDVYCGTVGSALRMEYAAIGSVVNMSARLMCKAKGGILIDDATYNHLLAHDVNFFQKLEPIKVKGRDEPLQVYSFNESGPQHSCARLHEDIHLPQYCRHPLKALLFKMAHTTVEKGSVRLEPPTWVSSIQHLFRGLPTASVKSTLAVVLIEGKAGSGRTSVVTWLKNQAIEANIQTSCVLLSKKDTSVEYGMFKKLFIQLMPKDLFLNNHVQRGYVKELLRLAYPKSSRSQGYLTLQYLGITCSMKDDVATRKKKPTCRIPLRQQLEWISGNTARNMSLMENLHHIFAYLLCVHPTLAIVVGLELADPLSLALLTQLGSLSSQSAIVCTALSEAVLESSPKSKASVFGARATVHNVPLPLSHSTWVREHRCNILALKSASLITLENYTLDEIDRMLCAALGVRSIPSNVTQLVQDFSGGSYFWVREILQFIKENGADQFMLALGESEETMPAQTPRESNLTPRLFRNTSGPTTPRRGSFMDRSDTTPHSPKNSGVHNSMRGSAYNSAHGNTRRGSSSACATPITQNNSGPTSPKPSKVVVNKPIDHLILMRFGSLSSEGQSILRKAAVIGVTFAISALMPLLTPHSVDHLSECLKMFVARKWIYEDLTCAKTYLFVHEHVRQLVYELTPPSERNKLHQLAVDHLVQTYPEDSRKFFSIWYHYQNCNTDLALQYSVKTSAIMLQSNDIYEYMDCLDVLVSSIKCCKSVYDIYILQHLAAQLQAQVESVCLATKEVPQSPCRSWWKIIFPTLRSVVRVTRTLKIAPVESVVPATAEGTVYSFQDSDSTSGDDDHISTSHRSKYKTSKKPRSKGSPGGSTTLSNGSHSGSFHKVTPPESLKQRTGSVGCFDNSPTSLNVDVCEYPRYQKYLYKKDGHHIVSAPAVGVPEVLNVKQYLLAKMDGFRHQLHAKWLQFGAEAGGAHASCGEPSEWQRAYLNITSCRIR